MDDNKSLIVNQIQNAFDFIQKLYNETSYLIKEIEGQLGQNEFEFQIIKPSGYSVSTRSSTGLETNNVYLWMPRKLSVAFVEKNLTKTNNGQNITGINKNLKVLYFKFILNEKNQKEPKLLYGVFYEVEQYKDWVKKFEHLMQTLESVDNKVFAKFPNIDYKDAVFKIKGKFKITNLLEINSSLDLSNKVITPIIRMYEQISAQTE
jgi:hypothetical protein